MANTFIYNEFILILFNLFLFNLFKKQLYYSYIRMKLKVQKKSRVNQMRRLIDKTPTDVTLVLSESWNAFIGKNIRDLSLQSLCSQSLVLYMFYVIIYSAIMSFNVKVFN